MGINEEILRWINYNINVLNRAKYEWNIIARDQNISLLFFVLSNIVSDNFEELLKSNTIIQSLWTKISHSCFVLI